MNNASASKCEIYAMFPAYKTEKEIRFFFLIFKRWVEPVIRIKTLTKNKNI